MLPEAEGWEFDPHTWHEKFLSSFVVYMHFPMPMHTWNILLSWTRARRNSWPSRWQSRVLPQDLGEQPATNKIFSWEPVTDILWGYFAINQALQFVIKISSCKIVPVLPDTANNWNTALIPTLLNSNETPILYYFTFTTLIQKMELFYMIWYIT